jgi:hypothetical protein
MKNLVKQQRDWIVPSAVTLIKWSQVGQVLNPHWPGAIQDRAYVIYISNTQRTTIASFPDDGGREGL